MSRPSGVYWINSYESTSMIQRIFGILTMLLTLSVEGFSQFGVDNHTVTVQVAAISVLQVNAGTVNLNISTANAVAGQDQMTTSDQTTTLLWGTNSSAQKITASTSLVAPQFTLKLVAVSPTAGTAAPEMTLSSTSSDLLLNIGRNSGSCQLRYTGVALASQGTGTDIHTITLTILAQ